MGRCVLGGAGNGKTVAAMHRAGLASAQVHGCARQAGVIHHVHPDPCGRRPFRIAAITTLLNEKKIEVANIDQWALSGIASCATARTAVRRGQATELWARALTRKPDDEFPGSVLSGEFESVILPQGASPWTTICAPAAWSWPPVELLSAP